MLHRGTRASNSQLSFKEADATSTASAVVSPSFQNDELVEEKGSLGNSVSIKEDVDKNTSNKFSTDIQQSYSNPVIDKDEEPITDMSSSSSINNNQRLQQPSCEADQIANAAENSAKQSDLVSGLQKKVAQVAISEAEEDMLSFDDQRLRDTQVIQNPPHISSLPSNNMGHYPLHAHVSANGGLDPPSPHIANNIPVVNNEYSSSTVIGNSSREIPLSNGHSYFHGSTEGHKSQNGTIDLGENSIISNILSMDFDPWDESLTSPRNLAKFLGESDKQPESHSHRVLSSRKAQNSNQSRFSFARQDECTDQGSNYGNFGHEYKNPSSDFVSNNNSIYIDNNKHGFGNGFSSFSYGEPENLATNYFPMPENKISGMLSKP